jgi:hypothetical protein
MIYEDGRECVEKVTYDSGALSVQVTGGGSDVGIYKGMPVEAAVAALRTLARHLEFGAEQRALIEASHARGA